MLRCGCEYMIHGVGRSEIKVIFMSNINCLWVSQAEINDMNDGPGWDLNTGLTSRSLRKCSTTEQTGLAGSFAVR